MRYFTQNKNDVLISLTCTESEEPVHGVHAQESAGRHQEGEEPHPVEARGAVHTVGPFLGPKSYQ
jgi:hypothetical protein